MLQIVIIFIIGYITAYYIHKKPKTKILKATKNKKYSLIKTNLQGEEVTIVAYNHLMNGLYVVKSILNGQEYIVPHWHTEGKTIICFPEKSPYNMTFIIEELIRNSSSERTYLNISENEKIEFKYEQKKSKIPDVIDED